MAGNSAGTTPTLPTWGASPPPSKTYQKPNGFSTFSHQESMENISYLKVGPPGVLTLALQNLSKT